MKQRFPHRNQSNISPNISMVYVVALTTSDMLTVNDGDIMTDILCEKTHTLVSEKKISKCVMFSPVSDNTKMFFSVC